MKEQKGLCLALLALVFLLIISLGNVQPVEACYGPQITASIDKTEVHINESVTVTGQICPPGPNITIRIAFTRPDYTYIEQYLPTDP